MESLRRLRAFVVRLDPTRRQATALDGYRGVVTLALGLALLLLSGCGVKLPHSLSMRRALEQAEGGATVPAGTTRQDFGYQAPYTPVVVPPDVRQVWVPTHSTDEGELVQGHWVYLRLTGWRWLTEPERREESLGVPVPPEASPPPWPAPVRAGRRPVVPWVEPGASERRGQAPTAPAPEGTPPAASGTPPATGDAPGPVPSQPK